MTFAEIVDQAQWGHADPLYALLDGKMRAWIRSAWPSDQIDDWIHDAFIAVWAQIKKGNLREPEKLVAFCKTILRRRAFQQHRKIAPECPMADFFDRPNGRASPEQVAIRGEALRLAIGELAKMPSLDRELLVRSFIDEQPSHRICREMGFSGTVMRLRRSRARIKLDRAIGATIGSLVP